MPFVTGVFDSWAAKSSFMHYYSKLSISQALKCYMQNRVPPGSWGWGLVTGWVFWPSLWLPSLQAVCVFICPTFCTGSCCQPVNQVDGWSRLRSRGKWQRLGKACEQWVKPVISLSQNLNIAPVMGSTLILSWAWSEVSLVVFLEEGFLEILSTEPAGL